MSAQDVLDCPMNPNDNDAGAETVAGYLIALLATLWREDEGFSGKRPFGNSGWQHEVYVALAKEGHIAATYNEDWEEWQYDPDEADPLIYAAIAALV